MPPKRPPPVTLPSAAPSVAAATTTTSSTVSAKQKFTTLSQRYYKQLTEGCGDSECLNPFCKSCEDGPQLKPQAATMLALQLAARQNSVLCEHLKPRLTKPSGKTVPRFLRSDLSVTSPSKEKTLLFQLAETKAVTDVLDGTMVASEANLVTEPLTVARVQSLIAASESGEEAHAAMVSTLCAVFASPDALSRSFMREGSGDGGSVPDTPSGVAREFLPEEFQNSYGGVDVMAVRKAYRAILSVSDPIADDRWSNSLELLLAEAEFCAPSMQDKAALRLVVIVLENPLLEDPNYPALSRVFSLIVRLDSHAHAILQAWFERYDWIGFRRLVDVCREYIATHVRKHVQPDVHVAAAAFTLGILYAANVKVQACEVNDFYVQGLLDKLDFKAEYRRWMGFTGAGTSMDSIITSTPMAAGVGGGSPGVVGFGDSTGFARSGPVRGGNVWAAWGYGKAYSVCDTPFILDPLAKVRFIHLDATHEMTVELTQTSAEMSMQAMLGRYVENYNDDGVSFLILDIRRDQMLEDAKAAVAKEARLKKPLKVRFVGEVGVDVGGLSKEFFSLACEALFEDSRKLFAVDKTGMYHWFHPEASADDGSGDVEFAGVLVGLAIYNGVALNLEFPTIMYHKLLGLPVTFESLKLFDEDLYTGLKKLLDMDGNVEDTLAYCFEISYDRYGDKATHELKPNGSNIPVTNANRQEYVDLVTQFLLVDSVAEVYEAFERGFMRVAKSPAVELCAPEELEIIVCGDPEVDFEGWESAAKYRGYTKDHFVIQWWWEVVKELSEDDKRKLLMFTTGSSRVPIGGLSTSALVIELDRTGDQERLPVAHTCFNILTLPEYSTKATLKERVLLAINNSTGFGIA